MNDKYTYIIAPDQQSKKTNTQTTIKQRISKTLVYINKSYTYINQIFKLSKIHL